MAVLRFNSQFNPHDVVGEPCKGDYIVERDSFLSPRDILRKYSLGLPIGDSALIQDEEYEDYPDDLTDMFPNAGEEVPADEVSAHEVPAHEVPAHEVPSLSNEPITE